MIELLYYLIKYKNILIHDHTSHAPVDSLKKVTLASLLSTGWFLVRIRGQYAILTTHVV